MKCKSCGATKQKDCICNTFEIMDIKPLNVYAPLFGSEKYGLSIFLKVNCFDNGKLMEKSGVVVAYNVVYDPNDGLVQDTPRKITSIGLFLNNRCIESDFSCWDNYTIYNKLQYNLYKFDTIVEDSIQRGNDLQNFRIEYPFIKFEVHPDHLNNFKECIDKKYQPKPAKIVRLNPSKEKIEATMERASKKVKELVDWPEIIDRAKEDIKTLPPWPKERS